MPKIIVVDDDKTSTALFEQVLLMYKYEVVTLNESAKTVEVASEVKPDLIILDLMMPDPEGFKVCRMLRADPNLRRTPIIIVSALNDLDSKQDGSRNVGASNDARERRTAGLSFPFPDSP